MKTLNLLMTSLLLECSDSSEPCANKAKAQSDSAKQNPGMFRRQRHALTQKHHTEPGSQSRSRRVIALWLSMTFLIAWPTSKADTKNGFDLRGSLIPSNAIHQGGPPRDGIPALTRPKLIPPSSAHYLQDDSRVLGISINAEARAYPIALLNWHEIVNDRVGGKDIVISYCPLCGTGVAWSARIHGKTLEFGVSGLLYNSDVLLYDRSTESLWSQIRGDAISGDLKGQKIERLPLTHTSWKHWREQHPHTRVLAQETGYQRDYSRNPYAGYEDSRALYFEVENTAPPGFHPKENVLGVELDGHYKAYPFSELNRQGKAKFKDTLGTQTITLQWNAEHQQATALDSRARPLQSMQAFWFAWFAFHPQTEVFRFHPD